MISNVKFHELAGRVETLLGRIETLENQVKAMADTHGGEIPPGMAPISTLAAEFGISTRKAEELANNTGVMLIKLKSGGFIVNDGKFREEARRVLRSAYWFHPLLGKFQLSGGIPQ